ncbi:Hypothetical Protein FCC1311_111462 [Hondaea fermentalgiana]|uniref:Uncharacterized protein n=1 Tax=Hondaea fermentalgiana TaxID=2315210 RepID=A0A2R5H1G9_9STRA|nr:Hypothetical Protein FCC1311_111462 [Hondaea fermentalgiana]|eukprot:GBG34923.1 Hypothetical Protein FCC1311_111462 [Hondaea fermentalgiana]
MSSSSSSGDAVAGKVPFSQEMQALMMRVHSEMGNRLKGKYDRAKAEAIANYLWALPSVDGCTIDFDFVCQILGQQKKNALRLLTGQRGHLWLIEGVDYKKMSRQSEHGQMVNKYYLTPKTLKKFCIASQTESGAVVREIFVQIYDGLRELKQALDAGEVALVRTQPTVPLALESSARERLKTCDLTKAVNAKLCLPGKRMDARVGFLHAKINESVMGMTKQELAEQINKKKSSFVARDYMSDAQQSQTAVFLALSNSFGDAEEMRTALMQSTREFDTSVLARFLHNKPGEVPAKNMTLKRARDTVALIEDAGPTPKRGRQLTLM